MYARFTKLTVGISLVYFGVLDFPVLSALVRYDFFPEGQRTCPVSLIFEGQFLKPPQTIERASSKKVDRSTPETVMASMLRAAYDGDTDAYNLLYAPGERTSSLAQDSKGKLVKATAKEKLQFGEFTIMVCEVQSPEGSGSHPQVFRQTKGEYFLTDAISNTNAAYELFRTFFLSRQNPTSVDVIDAVSATNLVRETFFAPGRRDVSSPVVVQYQGKVFNAPLALTNAVTQANQDLSTPEGALIAVYAAARAADFDWYLSLIAPDERDSANGAGVPLQKVLKKDLPNLARTLASNAPRSLVKVLHCGDFAIALTSAADAKAGSAIDWLALRKINGRWLLSDKLRNGEPILSYALGKIETISYFYQKILPLP
jgi:hypothetical protein